MWKGNIATYVCTAHGTINYLNCDCNYKYKFKKWTTGKIGFHKDSSYIDYYIKIKIKLYIELVVERYKMHV